MLLNFSDITKYSPDNQIKTPADETNNLMNVKIIMTQNFIKVHTIFNDLPVRKMKMSRAAFYLSKSQNK